MSLLPRTLEPEVMDTAEEAVDYDSMDHARVNRVFVEDLLTFSARCKLNGESWTVLDLGTGTALIPLELTSTAPAFGHVLACDLSVEMLKLARQHILAKRADQLILPAFCDAKQLPLADSSCNVVMSNSIVHHIPAPVEVFREIQRVLRPEGVLFIRDLMRPTTTEEVEHIVELYAGSENAHQQQLFRQSLHAALTVDEVRDLLSVSGFPRDWVHATSDRHWTIAGQR